MSKDLPEHALDRLFAAARSNPPPDWDLLEFGFETRLLARLREESSASVYSWAWRLCPFFAILALAAGAWNYTSGRRLQADASFLADASRHADAQLIVSYMTGGRP